MKSNDEIDIDFKCHAIMIEKRAVLTLYTYMNNILWLNLWNMNRPSEQSRHISNKLDYTISCNTVVKLWQISAQETQALYSIIMRFSG